MRTYRNKCCCINRGAVYRQTLQDTRPYPAVVVIVVVVVVVVVLVVVMPHVAERSCEISLINNICAYR